MRIWPSAAAVLACAAGPAFAQSVESDVTPESAHLVKESSEFAVPQVVSDDALQLFNFGFNGVPFALAIPNDLAFFGLQLHTQAIVFENVNPLGLTVSDAATMVIGG